MIFIFHDVLIILKSISVQAMILAAGNTNIS